MLILARVGMKECKHSRDNYMQTDVKLSEDIPIFFRAAGPA